MGIFLNIRNKARSFRNYFSKPSTKSSTEVVTYPKLRLLNRFAIGLVVLSGLTTVGIAGYIKHIQPNYEGSLPLSNTQDDVNIYYDDFGIPHIYASTEEDAYRALGYIHAQERLFQMDLLRRVGQGRLSELFGEEFIQTDKTFRTFGFKQLANKLTQQYLSSNSEPFQKAALAYIDGINQFIEFGETPLEFTMLSMPKEKFTPEDIFLITAYLSFNFTEGFNIVPAIHQIRKKLGDTFLADFDLALPEVDQYSKQLPSKVVTPEEFGTNVPTMLSELPIALWAGSNAWVISANKTKSGKPILVNDTHMGFVQPTAWFEAHIETPDFSFYGNFVAGFPFGLVGHNKFSTWGLTILGNDDTIFYKETFNPNDSSKVKYKNQWEDIITREETIKVKDSDDINFTVKETRHGPIINNIINEWSSVEDEPVSVAWSLFNEPGNLLEATYELAHADSMQRAKKAVSQIGAPGLNVLYADVDGNIAHWIMARIMKFPENVQTSFLLDGSTGLDENIGYYSFEENPHRENPAEGILVSANNAFGEMPDGKRLSGYFAPDDRVKAIREKLVSRNDWTMEDMKDIILDDTSSKKVELSQTILQAIRDEHISFYSDSFNSAHSYLSQWNGEHELDSIAPTIYYKFIYNLSEQLFKDTLGDSVFDSFINTNLLERSLPGILENKDSVWWNNRYNQHNLHTRSETIRSVYRKTIFDLTTQLGDDLSEWKWGKVHTIEHKHPLAQLSILKPIFNVGPFPVTGGNEVINMMGFELNSTGVYNVNFGPAMRIIIDLADMENSYSISPTGQSGSVFSQYYDDQAELYVTGEFRKQLMNDEEIFSEFNSHLTFYPNKEG